MKTISAKEFQLRQSEVLHEVARGTTYEVTFHGKPWVELRPKQSARRPAAGSAEAFRASLEVKLASRMLPAEPDYKRLRRERLAAERDT